MKQDSLLYSALTALPSQRGNKLPALLESTTQEVYIIILTLKGEAIVRSNKKEYRLGAGELLIANENSRWSIIEISQLYEYSAIVFNSRILQFLEQMKYRFLLLKFLERNCTIIKISKGRRRDLKRIIARLFKALNRSSKARTDTEALQQLVGFVFYELYDILTSINYFVEDTLSRHEMVVFKFYNLVETHATNRHCVSFYADSLHMSRGHLCKIVKRQTLQSPKKIIEEKIIKRAQVLLADRELTIYQVADALNFTGSSTFSNFYKKHTALTPSQFRNQL